MEGEEGEGVKVLDTAEVIIHCVELPISAYHFLRYPAVSICVCECLGVRALPRGRRVRRGRGRIRLGRASVDLGEGRLLGVVAARPVIGRGGTATGPSVDLRQVHLSSGEDDLLGVDLPCSGGRAMHSTCSGGMQNNPRGSSLYVTGRWLSSPAQTRTSVFARG